MLDAPFPDFWRTIIERNVAHWKYLNAAERDELEHTTQWLVIDKRWEAARGFELDDEIKVTIAAQAALLTLGTGDEYYDDIGVIIVHPTTVIDTNPRLGPAGTVSDAPQHVLGQAYYRGPILLAWDQTLANARHPERGHNVVFHEFAHKLDMADDVVDGTPPLPDDEARARWTDVCTAAYEALREGRDDGLLDGYAATNPAEFFAVATEVFFDLPIEMEQRATDLYGVLREFYRQDPAARVRAFTLPT
jgi:Mlc titration factor MtfA (ptsG expression regulator)